MSGWTEQELNDVREGWIDGLCESTINHLLRGDLRYGAGYCLAPWVRTNRLTLATMLSKIAGMDAQAESFEVIGEWLIASGMMHATANVTEVVDQIVIPAVLAVRVGGMPGPRPWDPRGAMLTMLELWVGHRLETHRGEQVQRELCAIWEVHNMPLVEALLLNQANPYHQLPPHLLFESSNGSASEMVAILVSAGALTIHDENQAELQRLGLDDRPDLCELHDRARLRYHLERRLASVTGVPADLHDRLREDFTIWDAQFLRCQQALTAYECELLAGLPPVVAERDQLLAGRHVYHMNLFDTDTLPSRADLELPPKRAPRWMQDAIIATGDRTLTLNVGPHPIWLVVAETPEEEAQLRDLSTAGEHVLLTQTEGDYQFLRLPIGPVCTDGLRRAIHLGYRLPSPVSAWQLLHLAAVGSARLVILRVTASGELQTVGAAVIELSQDACAYLSETALRALADTVNGDPRQIAMAEAFPDEAEVALSLFEENEQAKSSDLLDMLIQPPTGVEPNLWRRYQEAARVLATVHANRVRAELDECIRASDLEIMSEAVEAYEYARERASRGVSTGTSLDDRQQAAIADLPEGTAFVHIYTRGDAAFAVYVARKDGDPRVRKLTLDLPMTLSEVEALVAAWAMGAQPGVWLPPTEGGGLFDALHHAISVMLTPLVEALGELGITRIVLSPAPPFDLLPLHAACVGVDRFLPDVFEEVLYAPTVAMLSALGKQVPRSPRSSLPLVVVHSGVGLDGVKLIGGPGREAVLIERIYGHVATLAGEDATPENVLTSMASSRIIHFAGHGYASSDQWANALILQGDTPGTARLTTGRILAAGDLRGADVVVLNACRSGSHLSTGQLVQIARGMDGAFLARGARAVISTFWDITDVGGVVFAALLHATLGLGQSPGKAFGAATFYLRNRSWRMGKHIAGSPEDAAEGLLDEVIPGWRDHLDRHAEDGVAFWGAFKLMGRTW